MWCPSDAPWNSRLRNHPVKSSGVEIPHPRMTSLRNLLEQLHRGSCSQPMEIGGGSNVEDTVDQPLQNWDGRNFAFNGQHRCWRTAQGTGSSTCTDPLWQLMDQMFCGPRICLSLTTDFLVPPQSQVTKTNATRLRRVIQVSCSRDWCN